MSKSPAGATPEQLGGFEIIRRLGAGGMAEVFVAKKLGAEGIYKILVVKRILPSHNTSRRFRTMFIEEAQLATRLNHPNIVQVYDFQDGGDEGLLLSMEYVEGTDFGKLMSAARAKGSRVPPWVGAYVVAEAAKGLHYAHERKDGGTPLEIVHRDVSPQNILVSFEGAVKIADFGIATANLFRDESGVIKGKFGYMSPEQARGEKVDRRSDIYALGVILHEILTGRPLHGGLSGDALLEAVRAGVVEPPSTFAREVPPELEQIVTRALAKSREDRFQTARDMSAAITRALFVKQEIVDASSVEATLLQLIGREHTSPGLSEPPATGGPGSVIAAGPDASAQAPASKRPDDPSLADRKERRKERAPREVRHVAVVTLALHGLDELEAAVGQQAAASAAEKIRKTLDDIAYKRGARWTWDASGAARAVVGLLANPARAAADSAWLAIDVHEALATAYEDLAVPIRASIAIVRGIATGERDAQGHLIRHELQEPANLLASIVGERTPVGRTWVAGGLYRLVRREFRWGDAPTIELPTDRHAEVPPSMRTYALERALTRDERLADMALAPSDLVGRGAEKADLHSAYHRAVAGGGEIVSRIIVGEMGIGKTALVATFLSELPPDARIVRVECSPARSELPFGSVSDLVRDVTGSSPEHAIEEVATHVVELLGPLAGGDHGQAIALCLAELATGKQLRAAEDDDLQYRKKLVYAGMRRMIAALASRQPLVVVIEGLQWSDRPGIELLAELLKRKDPLPVLVVLVTRPEERVLGLIEGMVRIELRGLSADEQVRLVEARLGVEEGVREVCAELVAKVAGNPFFLLEMVDALLERGVLEIRDVDAGRHALVRVERPGDRQQALPSTLEQIIGDRLRELPPEEHAVVDWLAVAGGPLGASDILALARLPDDEAVVRLLARGLCDRRGDDVDFRHPLARDVAYMALEHAERVQMHKRLGEHLATTPLASGLSAAIVARHLARGEAHDEAADFYLEAAAAARASFQTQLSTRYYQRAISLVPETDPRRLVAHEALEAIYRVLGRRRERKKHLTALRNLARSLGHPKWVALALARTARQSHDEGFLAQGVPYAQKAEEVARLAKAPAIEVDAQATLSELLRELGDVQGALAACDRALATANHPTVTARARGDVLRARGVLLRRVGRVREAVECHAQAIAIFRKTGAKRQEARAKNALAYAMFVLESYEDAITLALESIGIDLAIGGRFQIAKTLTNIGLSYARLGDLPRALAYLKRAREAHERYGDQDSRADTLLVSAEVLAEHGDVDAAHVFCGDAGALNAVTNSAYDSVHERIVRALLARATGDSGVAVMNAYDARQAAESQALVSFNLYATAIEAAARVDIGEAHTAILLATTAFGAVETIQGSEFGLEVRALCSDALTRAGSPQSAVVRGRAAAHARAVGERIRDARLKQLFFARPLVAKLLADGSGGAEGSAS